MKRHLSLLTVLFLAGSLLFTGCGQNVTTSSTCKGESQTKEDAQTQAPESISPSNSPEQPEEPEESSAPENQDGNDNDGTPVVYFTSDISAEGMVAIYEVLGWTPTGNVAVKLSTGEPPASNYLDPQLIKDVVEAVDGTIVECNTAYGGSRSETAMHYQVAEDHGFTEIADFQILDENGSMTLPVEGGSVLTENYVGAAFADYDSYLVLSHFICGAAIKTPFWRPWQRRENPCPTILGTASGSSISA